ncbi:hypothetical protein PN36_06550 [Candidatus Thiomargarita nelsonii]|uniref:Uncharacterized protein n=1 Tax=Candidatus Thiomargarita nelsonii TaxID=1003181 RepID=A0A4E0R5X9_9GAMM|nr:hypothetical protein PN36_06550 [Candidatus Thiomargarita nelsonii]
MNKFLESFSDIERVKNASVFISCKYFLLWNEGIDLGEKIATTYPDLFDPLICLIESGGEFGFHHGELLVGGGAIPLNNWKRFADAKIYLTTTIASVGSVREASK